MDPITLAMSLAQFAPSIMRWLTNSDKAADAAQSVVSIAQQITGAPSAAEALGALAQNPQAQLEFRRALMEREIEFDKLYLADVASARTRDIAIQQAHGGNTRADVMVTGAVAGLVACLLVLIVFRKEIPGEVVGIVSTIAGIFGSCLKDAYSFEFGSSRGSKEKDALLGEIARGP